MFDSALVIGVPWVAQWHEFTAGNPVRRCHVSAAPCTGERDGSLGCDQGSVRADERVRPDVVLPHPAQPRAAQRRVVQPDQQLRSGVAGFGQQNSADAGGDAVGACVALAYDSVPDARAKAA